MPPPANVLALALVRLIVPVPVTVNPVDVKLAAGEPVDAIEKVPEPIANVRVAVPVDWNPTEPV